MYMYIYIYVCVVGPMSKLAKVSMLPGPKAKC